MLKSETISVLSVIYPSQLFKLSPFEQEIFHLAIHGFSYKEMARLLPMPPAKGGIANALAKIRKKLGVDASSEMIAAYWRGQSQVLHSEIALIKAQHEAPNQQTDSPGLLSRD